MLVLKYYLPVVKVTCISLFDSVIFVQLLGSHSSIEAALFSFKNPCAHQLDSSVHFYHFCMHAGSQLVLVVKITLAWLILSFYRSLHFN